MKVTTLLKILCCLCVIICFSGLAYAKEKNGISLLKKSYLILNLTDLNDLPKADRWLFKDHANDTVSINGPILSGYSTYRALFFL